MASGAPGFLPVGLATLEERAPAGDGWLHEEKLDGYRIEAVIDPRAVRLFSRNAKEWTSRFPGVVEALGALPVRSAVLDGEVVAVDEHGVTNFQRLQQAMEHHAIVGVRYHLFDVLWLDGTDVRDMPLLMRRALLLDLLASFPRHPVLRPTRVFRPSAGDPLAQACALGIEGVVSKRDHAPYPLGRSPDWVKSKCARRQEFVVVGFTDPQRSRPHLGALLLGVYDGGRLRYVGKVGTGFDVAMLGTLRKRLDRLETRSPDIDRTVSIARGDGVHWVRPELVAEVTFTEWTVDGLLRHPVFKGLRADKLPREVRRED